MNERHAPAWHLNATWQDVLVSLSQVRITQSEGTDERELQMGQQGEQKPNTSTILPYADYDYVLISYSGGKDSLACVLHMIEEGVDPAKIELWHQHVDGEPGTEDGLMDWPVTESYVRMTGKHLGMPVRFQWRDGGFEKEMLRNESPTGDVYFENENGEVIHLPTKRADKSTRRKFPQVSADLSVRWCSAYLKIDVFARAVNNDPRFRGKNVLVVTGERREESTARSRYAEIEEHRCNSGVKRVDGWRAIIDWSEQQVWDIIARHKIQPHPAYLLGWGRVSCLACIFGDNDQWASVREVAPKRFNRISLYEGEFGYTIKKGLTVIDMADKGKEFVSDKPQALVDLAMGRTPYAIEDFRTVGEWKLPSGAYKRCGGPT